MDNLLVKLNERKADGIKIVERMKTARPHESAELSKNLLGVTEEIKNLRAQIISAPDRSASNTELKAFSE